MLTGSKFRNAAISASLELRLRNYNEAMVRFAAETGRSIGDVLRQQARLCLRTIIKLTPPFQGLNDSAESFNDQRRVGLNAVEKQIGHAFKSIEGLSMVKAPRNSRLGANLQTALIKGDTQALSVILTTAGVQDVNPDDIIPAVTDSLHNRVRNRRGRIPFSKNHKGLYWVIHKTGVTDFIAKKQKLVGKLKGGWAAAAAAFKVTLPQWIRAHASGNVVDNSDKVLNPQIRMVNTVSYANAADQDIRSVSIAFYNQTGKLERQMEAKLNGAWSHSGAGK